MTKTIKMIEQEEIRKLKIQYFRALSGNIDTFYRNDGKLKPCCNLMPVYCRVLIQKMHSFFYASESKLINIKFISCPMSILRLPNFCGILRIPNLLTKNVLVILADWLIFCVRTFLFNRLRHFHEGRFFLMYFWSLASAFSSLWVHV